VAVVGKDHHVGGEVCPRCQQTLDPFLLNVPGEQDRHPFEPHPENGGVVVARSVYGRPRGQDLDDHPGDAESVPGADRPRRPVLRHRYRSQQVARSAGVIQVVVREDERVEGADPSVPEPGQHDPAEQAGAHGAHVHHEDATLRGLHDGGEPVSHVEDREQRFRRIPTEEHAGGGQKEQADHEAGDGEAAEAGSPGGQQQDHVPGDHHGDGRRRQCRAGARHAGEGPRGVLEHRRKREGGERDPGEPGEEPEGHEKGHHGQDDEVCRYDEKGKGPEGEEDHGRGPEPGGEGDGKGAHHVAAKDAERPGSLSRDREPVEEPLAGEQALGEGRCQEEDREDG